MNLTFCNSILVCKRGMKIRLTLENETIKNNIIFVKVHVYVEFPFESKFKFDVFMSQRKFRLFCEYFHS